VSTDSGPAQPRDPSARVAALTETGGEGYTEEEPNSLTAPQLALFLESARRVVPRRWFPLFATLGFTAMRVGEATALKWTDITEGTDEAPGVIRVVRSHWRGRVGSQKTGKRIRLIPVPKELAAILADHRGALVARLDEELTERQRAGAQRGLDAGWLFPNNKGGPTAGQVVRKPLLKVLAALKEAETSDGVDHLTVHGLRRTRNNLLRQVTHGEVVRAVTGHVTERMTLHYSHVAHAEKAQAVAQVVSLVRARSTKLGLSVGLPAQEVKTAGEASL
jgi:integrase